MGAEVLYCYVDGVLTDEPLWPWPMEDRIFKETQELFGQGISVTWEANGGLWKTLDGIYDLFLNADIIVSKSSGSAPFTVTVQGNANNGNSPYGFAWNFGDGQTSGEQNPPAHTFSQGEYDVVLTVTDNAGDKATDTLHIIAYVDNTPPSGTITINNGASQTGSQTVTITLSVTEDLSGLGTGAQMKLSNDNVTWSTEEDYTATKSWALAPGAGNKTVYLLFSDAAGNWLLTPVSAQIVYDPSQNLLVYHTFEQDNEGWGGAQLNTAFERDNTTAFAGDYSIKVNATSDQSALTVDVHPAGWQLDLYPKLSFAYKIPAGTPVGLFINNENGDWICWGVRPAMITIHILLLI